MSTQNRTGGGSRNQKKSNAGGGGVDTTVTSKKSEVSKPEKEKTQPKPTAEQIRIAQITDISSGSEDPKMREKVATLIEMTQRSEEEVCCALYECDNNLEKAVVFLLETLPVGAFETSSKKKKNRVTSSSNEGNGDGEWTENNTNIDNRERSRNRSGIRGGRGGSDSRGWRSREERNTSDSKGRGEEGGWRGGRGRGSSRGGFGGSRGGRGGRMGPRGMGSRDQGRSYSRHQQEPQEVDTWDNNMIATNTQDPIKQDNAWGDWDNEDYVGSLKETKVFVPSSLQNSSMQASSELSAPPGLEQHILNQPPQLTAEELVQQYSTTVVSSTTTAAAVAAVNPVQFPDIHSNNTSQHLRLGGLDSQQLNPTSTLSAEQSQYFNSLPSQNAAPPANFNSYQASSPSYVSNTVFGDQVVASQPAVRRARAKVPPPSKIPVNAVEMPSDTLNNIGYLDVHFGALEYSPDGTLDRLTEKFNATSIDTQQNVQSQDVSNDYQPKSNVQQSALTAGLQTSQIIPSSDTLSSQQNDSLTSGYTQRGVSSTNVQQVGSNVGVGSINSSGTNSLDQLSKNDPYNQSNSSNAAVYQSSYSSNASAKTPSYQSTGAGQGYNSTNYTNTQASSANTYQPSSNNYNSYNQNSVNSYQTQNQASVNSSSNSVSGVNAVSNSNSAQNIPVGGSNSAVNSASSNTNAGYLSSQYQSNQTTSTFPSQQSAYQNSQSVYGNTGFTGSTNTSSSQYSNFSNSKLKETSTPASSHFESVSSVTSSSAVSSTVSSVSSSSTTTNNLSSPSLGLTNTKVTNSTAKSSGGIVPNVQMVSQFIQTGLPYFQQPAVYSYEDIQIMQQRMPPHVTQYYDINYPPTSLGAAGVRDANLSVAYSTMADGRFARNDNNSSPVSNVSSTMSQQAGSSGTMLNVPYAYFYGGNMMPGSFQYSAPAIYPQQMPTANATSGGQFPKQSYNSGYGTASYDALSQATKDYNKGYIEYPASGVSQQSKAQNVTNPPQASSGSDITSSMYGKSHVALNKVNSYEKQSFHSGTPPPFNMTGTQTAGATSAQPYGVYIQPMPPAHHTMNLHQPIHQMDGRIHNSSRRDSNSTGQRQQPNSQSKTGTKQGYSASYWPPPN